ncbi:hypothetical protein ELI05_06075 [Rhizobium leguminosarum]|nr:hypothetical protein ELI05_06075 [Rhizobium leguminosarum]
MHGGALSSDTPSQAVNGSCSCRWWLTTLRASYGPSTAPKSPTSLIALQSRQASPFPTIRFTENHPALIGFPDQFRKRVGAHLPPLKRKTCGLKDRRMQVLTRQQFTPSHDDLESLFVNNEKLDRVATYLNRFNPIRTMRMEAMEIRHSAILGWLLDPRETHGFGDRFLKAFICEALRGRSGSTSPMALQVLQADLRDATVRREWQNIDIFILSPSNNWAFVVENKFRSTQHEGQLQKYIERVKSVFEADAQTLTVSGIFLTLQEEEPQDKSYAPLKYADICELLPRLIALEGQSMGHEVKIFLQHYLEIIQDATGMNDQRNEMEKLARQLYRTHKKVLDFVIEHGASTDFVVAAEAAFGSDWQNGELIAAECGRYLYNSHTNTIFSFVPESWSKALGGPTNVWEGCQNWWAGYPLICWFRLFDGGDGSKGHLRLFAEVGPITRSDLRKKLIEDIKSLSSEGHLKNISLQQGATDAGRQYSKFLKNNKVDIQDVHDADEIAKAIGSLLRKFEPYFEAVANILLSFKEYASETSTTV